MLLVGSIRQHYLCLCIRDTDSNATANGSRIYKYNRMSSLEVPIHLTVGGVMLASIVLHRAVRVFGQPQVIGEILAGLVVGVALNLIGEAFGGVSGALARSTASTLDHIGTIGLVFVVVNALFRAPPSAQSADESTGRKTVLIVTIANSVPALLVGGWLAFEYSRARDIAPTPAFVLLVGVAMSISAVPVLARILAELNMESTKVGELAFRAACWTDVIGWLLVGVALSLQKNAETGYFALSRLLLLVGVYGSLTGVRWLMERRNLSPAASNNVVLIALMLTAGLTHLASLHLVFGAFMVGSVFASNSSVRQHWLGNTGWITDRLFCPLFFAIAGMKLLSPDGIPAGELGWGVIFLVASIFTKVLPLTLAGQFLGLSRSEGLLLGLTLNTRGLMELVILSVGLSAGIFSPTQYSIFVLVAVVTTVMSTPLCRSVQGNLKVANA